MSFFFKNSLLPAAYPIHSHRHLSRLLPVFVGLLFLGIIVFSPGAAFGGEILEYDNEPAKLADPLDYFPSATAANFIPQAGALFPKTSSSNNTVYYKSGNIYSTSTPFPGDPYTRSTAAGNVYGGIGASANLTGDAEYNKVFITGGQVYDVYGGMGSGVNVNNNSVEITNALVRNSVYGGRIVSVSGVSANSNAVSIGSGAIINNNVYGAYSSVSGANNNSVNIKGGEVRGDIIAGAYGFVSGFTFSGNSVTIGDESKIINANISGGYGNSSGPSPAHITSNVVTINGGEINLGHSGRGIYGGRSAGGGGALVLSNEVFINGGTIEADIYGGFAYGNGTAQSNTVSLFGGTVTGNVYGGDTASGIAENNLVKVAGATVKGNVYGGHTTSGSNVRNNKVELSGGAVTGTVFGSNLATWQGDGNSLAAIRGLTNVGGIGNFQFATINNGATINVTGSSTYTATFNDLTNSGVLSFHNESLDQNVARIMGTYSGGGLISLDALVGKDIATPTSADSIVFDTAPASSVTLAFKLFDGSKPSPYAPITKIAEVSDGTGTDSLFKTTDPGYGVYAYEINRVGNEYLLGLTDAHVGETGKVYSEAAAAGLAQIALTETLLRNSIEGAMSATAGRGFGISASFGYSGERIRTGSHVDLNGASGLFTLAYNQKGAPISMGLFGEMFIGKYKTSNMFSLPNGDFNVRSNGSLQNYGGGLFVQYRQNLAKARESGAFTVWTPGLHIEAMARAGYSKMDFETNASNPSTFDTGSMYHGASLGGGYVFEPTSKFAVDLYGHGTWISMGNRSVDDNLGQHIEFKKADSLRVISGLRTSYMATEQTRPYGGVAIDWETMGRPKAYIDGHLANRADLSGVSVLFELGIGSKVSDSIFIDAKAAGSVGQRRGGGGLIEARYQF